MKSLLLALIWLYRWTISPVLGNRCRFTPTCSQYAQEAIRKYGARRGMWLTLKRLYRCRPGFPGGSDPVT